MPADRRIPTLGPKLPAGALGVDLLGVVDEAMAALGRPARCTLIVNDPQRGTATQDVLRSIAQVSPRLDVRVLVATGSHSFGRDEMQRFERSLSSALPLKEVSWHDARDRRLAPVGADGGWRGHAWLIEKDPILVIGSVEPHYFAGFTGAHKTCTVGCASFEDIQANHAAAVQEACAPCRLRGNPVFEHIERMLRSLLKTRSDAGPLVAIDLVQIGPRIVAAHAGDPRQCLIRASALAEQIYHHRLDEPLDGLIAEVSGPLGCSFYQAEKGIKNNEYAVRDGGVIILVARCDEGIGQAAFTQLLAEASNWSEAKRLVDRRGYRLGDHKAVRLRRLTDPAGRAVRLFVVSDGLSPADAELLGVRKACDEQDAMTQTHLDPSRDRVVRLADAANVVVTAGV